MEMHLKKDEIVG